MELNWTTFLLEIINFLVLVWVLKRFLYKPVLDIIVRRRQGIERTLEETREERRTSETLKTQYENRLADWEQEREVARQTLQREIEAERRKRFDLLENELQDERKRQQVLAERQQQMSARLAEMQALTLGADFVSRLLRRLAGPKLEALLMKAAIEDLTAMPTKQRQTLSHAWKQGGGPIEVTTAYPLEEACRKSLEKALAEITGEEVFCDYQQSSELIGGLRLKMGYSVLGANLQDDLKSFAEAGRD